MLPKSGLKTRSELPELDEDGQALTEYILMTAVIVGIYLGVTQGLTKLQIPKKLTALVTGSFSAAYQFGHTKAKGFDDGPSYHPRAVGGNNNFRIFLNPRTLE